MIRNDVPSRSVLITGALGYAGQLLVKALANGAAGPVKVIATDLRTPPPGRRLPGVEYVSLDVRSEAARGVMDLYAVDTVVHLAAVVNPGRKPDRQFLYDVEVEGTRNIVDCAIASGVGRFIVTSSGAAYGYHADNPVPLDEEDELRGNVTFAYSHHKRLVEEMLARRRVDHPELEQLILRPGFILGKTTSNQITALLSKSYVLGLSDAESPFTIIWDEDVVGVILKGLKEGSTGIYNLAGDGSLSLREMAAIMGKRYVAVPSSVIERSLSVLHRLALSPYGPEQVDFLRYRPVLSNRRLKEELRYVPMKTTREVFDLYLNSRK